MEISSALVVGLGMGTVFVGLIAIIILCYIMSGLCNLFKKKEKTEAAPATAVKSQANAGPIENKQAILAASCAVIAEELGTEVKNIKVLSFKRI